MTRVSMTNFRCVWCGWGSLVRSNFKGLPQGGFECKDSEACRDRRRDKREWERQQREDCL